MNRFNQLPEFEKEIKRLGKKYPSLSDDIDKFKQIINQYPTGIGKNFEILHNLEKVKIIKSRLACKSLRDRSVRIIYAYHNDSITFVYIEIYYKGDKENEDRDRIKQYLKSVVK
ncbi:MAG: hypothetical protein WC666_01975 [Candidatus Paceibacterota bacterium]|jgi:archaellum component FlaC